ncbi:MFS transporter, AAHS family, benzoate transport protein [Alteribacillus persepolensis]|uniref:MFS transporter, AAHS family, benzoate transport protein n=1 Tax=Alteribacillus persepolensis TaxID=568899 RepID=A0A1G8HR40_9BACI|nr:MFS transporter [Alteribacillus persepolensis]SDI09147.1 MFS transporter, AAHS family, benzoate transport protein [Alteribacillus persepolensis]
MRKINVAQMVDESRFNSFHLKVLLWCAFILWCDGFDLTVLGSVIPSLTEEWGMASGTAGLIGSLTLFGALLGAFSCGILADKFGRKKVVVSAFILFNLMTLLQGFSQGVIDFAIYRFIGGLGLGGIMPIVIALTTEYAPKSMRNMLVGLSCVGFATGGIVVALLGIYVIPNLGWEWMFFIGGLPLLAAPFLIKYLPESLNFLIAKGEYEQVGQILKRLNPSYTPEKEDTYEIDLPQKGMPVAKLFEEKRGFSTILFWIATACVLYMMYGLSTWLPQLMVEAGYPLTSSLSFLFALNFGAIVGQVWGGWLADRVGVKRILVTFFTCGGLCLVLLGLEPGIVLLYLLVALAGAGSQGTQVINLAYITNFYPAYVRSTGVGSSLGLGRIGAIIGPAVGGIILELSLPLQINFIAYAIPGFIAAMAMWLVQDKYSNSYGGNVVHAYQTKAVE